MAKRYHESKKERHDEHMGMERYERGPVKSGGMIVDKRNARLGAEMYAGMEPRRRQELEDAGMIHEDHRQVANLPQEVIYRDYPKTYGYTPEDLDDTLRGIDRQMDYDDSQKMKHFYPKKV